MKQNNLQWMFKCYKTQSVKQAGEKASLKRFFLIISYIFKDAVKVIRYVIRKMLMAGKKFEFKGQYMSYFLHMYNRAWDNERTIEIPIFQWAMLLYSGKRILEVGNVSSHYFQTQHDIVDKYEDAKGIISQDIIDYNPKEKYDLIVTLSTLEHVGFDEEKKDPKKVDKAIEHLKKLLKPGGMLLFTIPIDYNLGLDVKLFKDQYKCNELFFYKRMDRINRWKQIDLESAKSLKYGTPYGWANGLIIGVINN